MKGRTSSHSRWLAAAIAIGVLATACGAPISAQAGAPLMSVHNMRVYHGDGFNISAPSDFAVEHDYPAPGPDQSILGVAFVVPDSMTTGTNLDGDSYIAVETLPGPGRCTAARFLSNSEPARPTRVGHLRFSVATSGEGAMGSLYEQTAFALIGSNPCLGVRYLIHSRNIAFFDPGTVRAFDRHALVAKFDAIRRSLAITR